MIDKDKIFKLFVDGKEIDGDKTHEVFHKKLEKFLKQEQPDYNVESTKEASEYTVYHRAWSYIKQIDLGKKEDVDAIINFDPKVFYKTLDGAIKFFENYEEYEKCAHLHKLKEIVKIIPK